MTALQHIASRSGLYWEIVPGKRINQAWSRFNDLFKETQRILVSPVSAILAGAIFCCPQAVFERRLFTDARLHFEKPWIQPRLPSLFVTTMTSRSGFDFTLVHIDKPQWAQVHIQNFGFCILYFEFGCLMGLDLEFGFWISALILSDLFCFFASPFVSV